MADEKQRTINRTDSGVSEGVMGEIGSLRGELAEVRELLYRGHGLERAIEEYCYLPLDLENPFRWGFIGSWGKGARNSCVHVHTSTEEEFFDDADCSPEKVAELAMVFTNPHTVAVCIHLFRKKGQRREEIRRDCGLSDEELDAAVEPLLDWRFAAWEDDRLDYQRDAGPGLNGQGVNYAVTLAAMAQCAVAYKERQEHK
jgi:hypothetical protein